MRALFYLLAAASPTTVTFVQHDVCERLLLVTQGGVEGFEGIRKGLHLFGALGHALAGAIQTIRKRGPFGSLVTRLPLFAARLLPCVGRCAHLRFDRRPKLQLGIIELEGLL